MKRDIFLCEIEQWSGQGRVVFYETAVEIAIAQPFLDFLHGLWGWPVANSYEFDWIHMEFSFRNDQTQVFHGCLVKGTFLGPEVEIEIEEMLENSVCKFYQFNYSCGHNKDVVKVDDNFAGC